MEQQKLLLKPKPRALGVALGKAIKRVCVCVCVKVYIHFTQF